MKEKGFFLLKDRGWNPNLHASISFSFLLEKYSHRSLLSSEGFMAGKTIQLVFLGHINQTPNP
jgi:hypothetical protein